MALVKLRVGQLDSLVETMVHGTYSMQVTAATKIIYETHKTKQTEME